jgi:hypothetical protein
MILGKAGTYSARQLLDDGEEELHILFRADGGLWGHSD